MSKKTKIILIVAGLAIVAGLIYWFNAGRNKANAIKNDWIKAMQKIVDNFIIETTTGLSIAAKPANFTQSENNAYEMFKKNITEGKYKTKAEIMPAQILWIKSQSQFNVAVWL